MNWLPPPIRSPIRTETAWPVPPPTDSCPSATTPYHPSRTTLETRERLHPDIGALDHVTRTPISKPVIDTWLTRVLGDCDVVVALPRSQMMASVPSVTPRPGAMLRSEIRDV